MNGFPYKILVNFEIVTEWRRGLHRIRRGVCDSLLLIVYGGHVLNYGNGHKTYTSMPKHRHQFTLQTSKLAVLIVSFL